MNRWQRLYAIQGVGAAVCLVMGIIFVATEDKIYVVVGFAIFLVFGVLGWKSFFNRP